MGIPPGFGVGLEACRRKQESWLESIGLRLSQLTWNIIKDEKGNFLYYEWDVKGADVNLWGYQEECLLGNYEEKVRKWFKFGEIRGGSFICAGSQLRSFQGFPNMVGRIFDMSFCPYLTKSQIQTLDGVPSLVDINFVCLGQGFSEDEIRKKCNVTHKVYC
ncbi:MAG: hypothetical protein ACI30J_06345 [Paludibacteraceae bacterium]